MELADVLGGPSPLAAALHRQIGRLTGAVPVEEVARALDIEEIRIDAFDGFEGMLLTDRRRSYGRILANARGGPRRARFTIAHELGHFLIESHQLSDAVGFRCEASDLQERNVRSLHQRQEKEANRFAIELLAPRHALTPFLSRAPDLRSAETIRDALEISMEAAARRFVELHDEALGLVVSRAGIVRYVERGPRFPWIKLQLNDRIAPGSRAHRFISAGRPGVSAMTETHAAAWLDNPEGELSEQTRIAREGHAITLLWASAPDEEAEDDGVEALGMPTFRERRR